MKQGRVEKIFNSKNNGKRTDTCIASKDKHNVLQKIMIGNIFGGVAAFILVFFLIGKWTLHRNFLHFHELINSNSFTPVLIMLCIGVISLIPFAISMYLCFYWYPKRVGKRKEVQRAYLQTLIEKLYQTEQNLLPDIKKIDTLAEQRYQEKNSICMTALKR
jgi:Ca2+/Na+ antiporter